ncbi:hypothetical protein CCMSSC00406_0008491 [Pleurotus cornucopiae]|uniref:Uncharacterized protein n=1 Tax=Pleurotus cornucopiae TaxID=5321 RepID=A0ACB7IIG5_PLECO|nr:hypothetical protein CCMSSC00406_0008491 [Pleurotus cornucopiae]
MGKVFLPTTLSPSTSLRSCISETEPTQMANTTKNRSSSGVVSAIVLYTPLRSTQAPALMATTFFPNQCPPYGVKHKKAVVATQVNVWAINWPFNSAVHKNAASAIAHRRLAPWAVIWPEVEEVEVASRPSRDDEARDKRRRPVPPSEVEEEATLGSKKAGFIIEEFLYFADTFTGSDTSSEV